MMSGIGWKRPRNMKAAATNVVILISWWGCLVHFGVVVNAWTTPARRTLTPRSTTTSAGALWAATTTTSTTATSTTTATSSTSSTTPLQATPAAMVELAYTEWTLPTVAQVETAAQDPPVVFLHGLLGNKRNFASLGQSLAKQLQKTKRRIFGLDMRNHGENTHHDAVMAEMGYASMADDVVAFLDKLQLDQVVLVGHSMGGKVAQAVALKYPHRVHGLVVLDMAPVEYVEQHDPTWHAVCSIVRRLDQVDPGSTKKQVDVALRPDIPDPALRAFCLTNWAEQDGQWKIPMHVITQQLPTLAAFDIDDTLTYAGDAFFIHGGQSRFVRHAHLPAIRQYFPNHMLTTIRGSGHWVHAEAPEDTLSLLLQFLER